MAGGVGPVDGERLADERTGGVEGLARWAVDGLLAPPVRAITYMDPSVPHSNLGEAIDLARAKAFDTLFAEHAAEVTVQLCRFRLVWLTLSPDKG